MADNQTDIAQLQALQTAHAVATDLTAITLPVIRAAIMVYLQNTGVSSAMLDPLVDAVLAHLQQQIDQALTPALDAPVVTVPADLPLAL